MLEAVGQVFRQSEEHTAACIDALTPASDLVASFIGDAGFYFLGPNFLPSLELLGVGDQSGSFRQTILVLGRAHRGPARTLLALRAAPSRLERAAGRRRGVALLHRGARHGGAPLPRREPGAARSQPRPAPRSLAGDPCSPEQLTAPHSSSPGKVDPCRIDPCSARTPSPVRSSSSRAAGAGSVAAPLTSSRRSERTWPSSAARKTSSRPPPPRSSRTAARPAPTSRISATRRGSSAWSTRCLPTTARIDGLVNNAGGQFSAPLADISLKGFEAVVRSNLTGGFVFMREVYNPLDA